MILRKENLQDLAVGRDEFQVSSVSSWMSERCHFPGAGLLVVWKATMSSILDTGLKVVGWDALVERLS